MVVPHRSDNKAISAQLSWRLVQGRKKIGTVVQAILRKFNRKVWEILVSIAQLKLF